MEKPTGIPDLAQLSAVSPSSGLGGDTLLCMMTVPPSAARSPVGKHGMARMVFRKKTEQPEATTGAVNV